MLESDIAKEGILNRMHERGQREANVWTTSLHLLPDDFVLIRHTTNILKPVSDPTKSLSYSTSCIGDVVPTFTSTVFAIKEMAVTSDAVRLKEYLIESLSIRLKFLL